MKRRLSAVSASLLIVTTLSLSAFAGVSERQCTDYSNAYRSCLRSRTKEQCEKDAANRAGVSLGALLREWELRGFAMSCQRKK